MITRVLIRGRQEGQRQRRRGDDRSRGQRERDFEDAMLLILKVELGAANQGMQVVSRDRKRGGSRSSLRPPEVTKLYRYLDFRASDVQNCKVILLCYLKSRTF